MSATLPLHWAKRFTTWASSEQGQMAPKGRSRSNVEHYFDSGMIAKASFPQLVQVLAGARPQ
jgi:hypothetical protein